METHHRIVQGDARDLDGIPDGSIDLVVTSPPYPMIELWDDLFIELEPTIQESLEDGRGDDAWERMHEILDTVWSELSRVLTQGGIAAINIGDATRRVNGEFRRYANHARITKAMEERGFVPLPTIYWHKPTNAATKFMGSGMIPPNAYATQEHEHLLLFRNGTALRAFEPNASRRYEAAYFWEERNRWFADRWTDIPARQQHLAGGHARDRAAAFPIMIPYRLIAMFSVYGDTVLDPFWGTGTTSLAAMAAARNSVGVELDPSFADHFSTRMEQIKSLARDIGADRFDQHRMFVEETRERGGSLTHRTSVHDIPVKTQQETDIQLYHISAIERDATGYQLTHTPLPYDTRDE